MSPTPPECSLHSNNGRLWTVMIYTLPEGAPHPVPLGYTGDCTTCVNDAKDQAHAYPFPAEVKSIHPGRTDLDFHDDCEPCNKFRALVRER